MRRASGGGPLQDLALHVDDEPVGDLIAQGLPLRGIGLDVGDQVARHLHDLAERPGSAVDPDELQGAVGDETQWVVPPSFLSRADELVRPLLAESRRSECACEVTGSCVRKMRPTLNTSGKSLH